jgi:nucleoside-diphosphate-sugar epimerase
MRKILIIGKRGFIGSHLYKYLKNKINVKIISFKNLKKFEKKLNNFDFIINTSINKNYILNRYNKKFDNDLKIVSHINNNKTIYCLLSTRKVYKSGPNLKENSKVLPKSNYSKNKLITERKISEKLKYNFIILRASNIIGNTKTSKRVHQTFIDIFQKNIQKGFVYDNEENFKDFLSIDKFCQILEKIIDKKLTGTFNISIGEKVYLNDLIRWLNKYNKKNFKTIKNLKLEKESFYLNNKKLMSKIKIKNSLNELKSFCYKYSRGYFANS